jgi:hypothetical protein
MKRIGGVDRAFIVLAVTWVFVIVALLLWAVPESQHGWPEWKDLQILNIVWFFFKVWIFPVGFMYGIVQVIIWVINGFRK